MATVSMGPPRQGKAVPLKDLKQPGATVAVLGLTPGLSGGLALVSWTNPAGRAATLQPDGMEVVLLEPLLHAQQAGGTDR